MRTLITIAAAAAALSLAGCGEHTLSPGERMTAENGARLYSERDGSSYISCSSIDSDGDGYVTCSAKTKEGRDKALLCTFKEGAPGCKLK